MSLRIVKDIKDQRSKIMIYELLKEKFPNYRHSFLMEVSEEILSLLDENPGVVSSAKDESGVYTDVGESHASGNTDQSPALVDGALKKITEAEKVINDFQFWCYEQRDNEQFVLALNISGAWINHLKLNAPEGFGLC